MKRYVAYGLAALLAAAPVAQSVAQQPTDKLPPGMNRPVGPPPRPGPGPGPGKPPPPAPRPPAPRPPAPRPPPPRPPGPSRPPPRPAPPRPRPPRPPVNSHRPLRRYQLGAYQRPGGYYFRQWSTGVVLPGLFRARNYWLTSPDAYGLRPPPPGTEWIRVDYDALLVTDATGEIIDIVYNIFY